MKVFISYSHKDEELARRVAAALDEAGMTTWYDQREIMPGDNWAEKIAQGLRESEAMVVLLTPHALDTLSVRREIEFALGEKAYRNRLIPVLVGNPQEFQEEKIPWILKHLHPITLASPSVNQTDLSRITKALKEVA